MMTNSIRAGKIKSYGPLTSPDLPSCRVHLRLLAKKVDRFVYFVSKVRLFLSPVYIAIPDIISLVPEWPCIIEASYFFSLQALFNLR